MLTSYATRRRATQRSPVQVSDARRRTLFIKSCRSHDPFLFFIDFMGDKNPDHREPFRLPPRYLNCHTHTHAHKRPSRNTVRTHLPVGTTHMTWHPHYFPYGRLPKHCVMWRTRALGCRPTRPLRGRPRTFRIAPANSNNSRTHTNLPCTPDRPVYHTRPYCVRIKSVADTPAAPSPPTTTSPISTTWSTRRRRLSSHATRLSPRDPTTDSRHGTPCMAYASLLIPRDHIPSRHCFAYALDFDDVSF